MNRSPFPALLLLLSGAAVCVAEPPAAPAVRTYIANDDHTDYMWTADEETYAGVFVDMLDYYLALADSTAANPRRIRAASILTAASGSGPMNAGKAPPSLPGSWSG